MLLRELKGTAIAVSDEETSTAQSEMARMEGVFAEPAGAIALAGLKHLVKLHRIQKDEKVVLIVSGFGFRDPGDADNLVDPHRLIHSNQVVAQPRQKNSALACI